MVGRPGAFDVRQHRHRVGLAQHATEGGHVALVVGWAVDAGHDAFVDHVNQVVVGVVPGVATLVVRRRWQAAVWPGPPPIGLALELRAMAGGAITRVDRFPALTSAGSSLFSRCGTVWRLLAYTPRLAM